MPLNEVKVNMLYTNRSWLIQKYVYEKINMVELAKIAGCCYVTLWKWMNILKIKRRRPGENAKLPQRKHIDLNDSDIAFINGLLLGDGSVYIQGKNRNKIALYGHGDKRNEYIIWLSDKFKNMGFILSGKIRPISNRGFQFKTTSYAELFDFYSDWYSNGTKAIPVNLKLTPTMLKNWYIGDGNNSETPLIDSVLFPLADIERLIQPLREIGIIYSLRSFKTRNRLRISTKSTNKFFDYILSEDTEVPPGYKYKFPEGKNGIK